MFKILIITLSMLGGPEPQVQSPSVFIGQGDSLLRSGKALKAVAMYEKAIASGALADGYSARARAWYELDRMDRFILDVETALDHDNGHPFAHFQRAQYAMRSRDWSLAKTSCDRALKGGIADMHVPDVRICRGEAFAKLGDTEAAIDDLRSGIDRSTDDPEAMRLLASLYNTIELHSAAAEVLSKLLSTNNGDNGDRINLGYELALDGKHEEAITHFKKALTADRNNPVALSNYAFSLYKLGDNELAETLVKKSLRIQPGNPHALRTRGMLRLAKGDRQKACSDLCLAKASGKFKGLERIISKSCGEYPCVR